MFLNNKYTKIYYQIIIKAQNEHRTKLNKNNSDYVYYESHHIIPSCLKGSNNKNNRILLTGREHFICHLLLTKMVNIKTPEWFKLLKAFHKMKSVSGEQQRYFNSKLFELYRNNFIVMNSGENHPMYGKKHTEETKRKMTESNFRKGKLAWNFGLQHTEETKRKMSESHKGIPASIKLLERMNSDSNKRENHPMYGKKHTEETKRKYSENRKNTVVISLDDTTKKVRKIELEKYLKLGWKLGSSIYGANKNKIYIHNYNLNKIKIIHPDHFVNYENEGWKLGRGKGISKERGKAK